MLLPALCALREHFASALAVSLGSHELLSKRGLSEEKMSLSGLQANNHSWTCWLAAPLQVLIGFVHPPLWPGAAPQPTVGCGFVQEIFSFLQNAGRARPGWDTGGYSPVTRGLQPSPLCSWPRTMAGSWQSLPGRGKVCMWCTRSPSPHSMNTSQASMGLSLGARVRHWDQQLHLAAQPWLGGLY